MLLILADKNRAFSHAMMILATLLISTSFPVCQIIAPKLDTGLLTLLRFFLASLIFYPIVYLKYKFKWPGAKRIFQYSLISFCLATFFWSMFEALRYTSALNAGMLYALVPGVSAIFSAILVRERLHRGKILAFVLGIFGSVWVVFRGDINALLSLDYNRGDLIFFGGVFLMSLYTPLVKRFHSGEPVPVMTFWIILSGTVWLFLFNQGAVWQVGFEEIEFSVIVGLLYLSVFTTIISFFLLQYATIQIGPTKVASYSYLNPVAVLIVTTLFFGHPVPSITVFPGIIIVLLAVIAIQQK